MIHTFCTLPPRVIGSMCHALQVDPHAGHFRMSDALDYRVQRGLVGIRWIEEFGMCCFNNIDCFSLQISIGSLPSMPGGGEDVRVESYLGPMHTDTGQRCHTNYRHAKLQSRLHQEFQPPIAHRQSSNDFYPAKFICCTTPLRRGREIPLERIKDIDKRSKESPDVHSGWVGWRKKCQP